MKKWLAVAVIFALPGASPARDAAAQDGAAGRVAEAQRAKPAKGERHRVRREFEAIFARQVEEYKAQFAAVKRGEELAPTCAPDFVLKRPDGTTRTCEQITAERRARFERIKAINFLVIEIGNIEVSGDEAVVYTTQRFSRVVPDEGGRDRTVLTDGTVHKEFWVRTAKGWESRGFEEVRQGRVTIN